MQTYNKKLLKYLTDIKPYLDALGFGKNKNKILKQLERESIRKE